MAACTAAGIVTGQQVTTILHRQMDAAAQNSVFRLDAEHIDRVTGSYTFPQTFHMIDGHELNFYLTSAPFYLEIDSTGRFRRYMLQCAYEPFRDVYRYGYVIVRKISPHEPIRGYRPEAFIPSEEFAFIQNRLEGDFYSVWLGTEGIGGPGAEATIREFGEPKRGYGNQLIFSFAPNDPDMPELIIYDLNCDEIWIPKQ